MIDAICELVDEATDNDLDGDQVEAFINQATWAALQGLLARSHDPEFLWKPDAEEAAKEALEYALALTRLRFGL